MPPQKKRQYPERIEQKKVAKFLRLMEEYGKIIAYTATAQATYTGFSQIAVNQVMGVRRGLPDLIVLLPSKEEGKNSLIFIEMKHPKSSPSDTSPDQHNWIRNLNLIPNVLAVVCKTGEEAITILTELIGNIAPPDDGEDFEHFLDNNPHPVI